MGTTSQNAAGILASCLGGEARSTLASGQDPSQASASSANSVSAVSDPALADPGQLPAGAIQYSTVPAQPSIDPALSPTNAPPETTQYSNANAGDPIHLTTESLQQITAIVDSQTYAVALGSSRGSINPVVVQYDGAGVAVTPGASAVFIGGQQVSAAGDGEVIVGSGGSLFTITLHSAAMAQPESLADTPSRSALKHTA